MLFTKENSKEEIFKTIKHELHRGALDPKHPFRFVTLATTSENGIDARYVVLRSVDEALNFFVFTDARSSKIEQLSSCADTVLLFYHPTKRTQIKVKGISTIKRNDEVTATMWAKIQGDSRKAYNQILAPGSDLQNPEEAFELDEQMTDSNFAVIRISPVEIEALQLDGTEHLRIQFKLEEKGWINKWIAP